jgi:hypothetical protein
MHAYRSPKTPAPLPNFPKLNSPVILDSLPMNLSESAPLTPQQREISAAARNMPAGVLQFRYAILSPGRREWAPRGVYFFHAWRAVSWPIISIPFWWLVGLSIEALSASRHDLIQPRIGWAGTCVAVLLFASGAVVAVGTLVDRSSHHAWTLILFGIGAALWAVLGGLTIAAPTVQRRIRRRLTGEASSTALTQPTVQ